MKNKELKNELAKLIDEIDRREGQMLNENQYLPDFLTITAPDEVLKQLRSKGLITYTINYRDYGGQIDEISVTPRGYTYIEDEKDERNKWIIRTVLVGAITSIITSFITSLIVSVLLQH
ncbi:hypothetical protein VNN36_04530 [Lactococcus garvieae]|uniref:hypothetical protein n=1 Tax=Lactococcus garvieae TaxID=1363 RepID=UPI0030D23602